MRLILKYTLALFALILCTTAQGQVADVVADKNEILIGEQVQLTLSVQVQKNSTASIKFPEIADTLSSAIEVISKTEIDTLKTGAAVSETRIEQQVFITSFDSGSHEIPPFLFEINDSIQKTQPLNLRVNTIPVDTSGAIKDLKPIYDVSLSFGDYLSLYWPYIAGGVVLLAIIILLIYFIRRRQKAPKPEPEEPKIPALPPAEEALVRLREIEQQKIYTQGKVKKYHTELTDVLRQYIERRFGVEATEQTSSEIIHNLRFSGLSKEASTNLARIFSISDMVKFAKENPTPSENEASIAKAIQFVEQTREIDNEEPEPDEKSNNV